MAGITTATVAHVTLATAGLSSLLLASRPAFDAVRYVGATYLLLLGVRRLLGFGLDDAEEEQAPRTRSRAYAQGVVVNLTNPKTIVFVFAFLRWCGGGVLVGLGILVAVWTPSRAR